MFTARMKNVQFSLSLALVVFWCSVAASTAGAGLSQGDSPKISLNRAQESASANVKGFEEHQLTLFGSDRSVCILSFEGAGRLDFVSVMGDKPGVALVCTHQGESYRVSKGNYSRVALRLDTEARRVASLEAILRNRNGKKLEVTTPFSIRW